ncbi:hypothetical protein [Tateyamaria sp.]|uniref:hypothetical protein n=1 Tax=Tateyamaria sp. TaxID=1929288 RepID=UPI00329FA7F6
MVEVDFSDIDAAEAWFEDQTPEVRSVMASRAALRVTANLGLYWGEDRDTLVLTAIRCTLTSAVRGLGRTADVDWLDEAALSAARSAARSAALSAAHSAHSAHSAALSAAHSAALSAALSAARSAALSAALSAHSATAWDSERLGDDLNSERLWAGVTVPDALQTQHTTFLTDMSKNPDWDFFRTWYEQMWEGTFTDWDLATEVAKIKDDVWDEGLAAVAEEFRGIEARLLSERLPQVEEIFKTDQGFYDVRSVISEPSKLIDSIENRVRFALDLAVQSNSCDLNDMSTAAKVLRHALDNCLEDPNALEQFLRRGSGMIKARIIDGTFSGDDELGVLVDTLDELALQLRADHPEVAQAVDARTRQRFKELDDKKRLLGATLIDDLKEGTTGRLETELDLASETLRDGISDDASTDALKQSGNRAAKISLAERAKQAESSGTMAALKMGLRSNKLVEFVMDLFSGGGLP